MDEFPIYFTYKITPKLEGMLKVAIDVNEETKASIQEKLENYGDLEVLFEYLPSEDSLSIISVNDFNVIFNNSKTFELNNQTLKVTVL